MDEEDCGWCKHNLYAAEVSDHGLRGEITGHGREVGEWPEVERAEQVHEHRAQELWGAFGELPDADLSDAIQVIADIIVQGDDQAAIFQS